MNQTKIYFNRKASNQKPDTYVHRAVKASMKEPSDKQLTLYRYLKDFCETNSINISFLGKPRNRNTISSQISAMYTLIKKAGLYESLKEFVRK